MHKKALYQHDNLIIKTIATCDDEQGGIKDCSGKWEVEKGERRRTLEAVFKTLARNHIFLLK